MWSSGEIMWKNEGNGGAVCRIVCKDPKCILERK